MKTDKRIKRVGLMVGMAALLGVVLAACVGLRPRPPAPAITWPDATPAAPVGVRAVTGMAHPRLFLGPTNLDRAVAHAATGWTKTVYDGMGTAGTPVSMTLAVEQAFKCRVEVAAGRPCGALAASAIDYVLTYVAAPAHQPAAVWAPISPTTSPYDYDLPWEATVGVALIYDWLYAYLDVYDCPGICMAKFNVQDYLGAWASIFSGVLATDFRESVSIGYGVILLATAGEWEAPAGAEADLATIADRVENYFLGGPGATLLASGQPATGGRYMHLNEALPQMLVLTAGLVENRYLAAVPARLPAHLDWLLYGGISATGLVQYADQVISENDATRSTWLQYAWLLDRAYTPEREWGFRRYRAADLWSTWRGVNYGDIAGKAFFVIFFDPASGGGYFTTAQTGKFFADTKTLRQGGLVFLRDGWSGETVVTLLSRYTPSNHQHYDYNSLTLSQAGVRLLVDHDLYPYFTANHGKDRDHSLVLVNGGGLTRGGSIYSNADDSTAYGMVPLFLADASGAVALGQATYALADVVKADGTYSTTAEITPALRADRTVIQSNALSQTMWAVLDDYSYSGAVSLTLQYVVDEDATISLGAGTTPTTITLAGQKLALFGLGFDFGGVITYTTAVTRDEDLSVHALQAVSNTNTARWLTLLAPATTYTPTVSATTVSGVAGWRVTLAGSSKALDVVANPAALTLTVGSLATNAGLALFGYNAAGGLTWAGLSNYTMTTYNGAPISTYTLTAAALITLGATEVLGSITDDNANTEHLFYYVPTATPTPTPTPTGTPATTTPSPTPTATPAPRIVEVYANIASAATPTCIDYNGRGGCGPGDGFIEIYAPSPFASAGYSLTFGGCAYTYPLDSYTPRYKVAWQDAMSSTLCLALPLTGTAALWRPDGTLAHTATVGLATQGQSWALPTPVSTVTGTWGSAAPSPGR